MIVGASLGEAVQFSRGRKPPAAAETAYTVPTNVPRMNPSTSKGAHNWRRSARRFDTLTSETAP